MESPTQTYHHPGEDKRGHPTSECGSRGCLVFTSADLNEGSALHSITKAREDAYKRGYIDGLEAAANTVENIRLEASLVHKGELQATSQILRDQADKLKIQ